MSDWQYLQAIINGMPARARAWMAWMLTSPLLRHEAMRTVAELRVYQRQSTIEQQLSQASLRFLGEEVIRRALPLVVDDTRRAIGSGLVSAARAVVSRRRSPGPRAAVLVDRHIDRDHQRAMRIYRAAKPVLARGVLSSVESVARSNAVSELASAIAETRVWGDNLPVRHPYRHDYLPVPAAQWLASSFAEHVGRAALSLGVATIARSGLNNLANPRRVAVDTVSNRAKQWATMSAGRLVSNVNDSQRAAIAEAIFTIYEDPRTGIPEAQDRIRESIGLQPRQVRALNNQRAALREEGFDRKTVKALTHNLLNRMLTQRADLIARTEVMGSINAGRIMLWTLAGEAGMLPDGAVKRWVTAPDERVCPVCRPLDEVEVPILESFDLPERSGRMLNRLGPPAHPRCRCVVVLGAQERNLLVLDAGSPLHNLLRPSA